MSAETLRRAAELMRERATAATEGRWSVEYISAGAVPNAHIIDRWFVMGHFASGSPTGPLAACECEPDSAHIASWHPAVALAVADWLDAEFDHPYGPTAEAIDVALTYLGESA